MTTFHLERHDEIQAKQVFDMIKDDRRKFFAQYRIYVKIPAVEFSYREELYQRSYSFQLVLTK